MAIYESLKKDHRKVQDLMQQLVNLDESNEDLRRDLLEQVRDELIPHSRAEEAVFYNSIRALRTAQDIVWHSFKEHMEAETLLRTLQAEDKINSKWKETAKKLQQALNHHIEEEEVKIIPIARQLFTDEEAVSMQEAFEQMKPKVQEGSFVQSTLDLIANVMPPRLAESLRTYTYR